MGQDTIAQGSHASYSAMLIGEDNPGGEETSTVKNSVPAIQLAKTEDRRPSTVLDFLLQVTADFEAGYMQGTE